MYNNVNNSSNNKMYNNGNNSSNHKMYNNGNNSSNNKMYNKDNNKIYNRDNKDNNKIYNRDNKDNNIYCSNCGKLGHIYKKCNKPIISYGLIIFTCVNNIIKYLLIQRKHTLGYMEFLRGRYFINEPDDDKTVMILFKQMTKIEINNIKNKSFKELWDDLWCLTNKSKINKNHICEYEHSKEKFLKLKNRKTKNLDYFCNDIKPLWEFPEWGFPKGRRNIQENNIDCARREFKEETSYSNDDYIFYNKVKPLSETFFGTNGIEYEHIYYVGYMTEEKTMKLKKNKSNEVGNIKWFTFDEIMNLIRPYHIERKNLLIDINKSLKRRM
jgi:ADP-ribose pyrophosphatase YjhB (NUDIX family)